MADNQFFTVIWIKNFSRDRREKVVMGENQSTWTAITKEAPQGSGPLLFLIKVIDLRDKIKNIFEMYADNSKVIAEVGDTNESSL